MGFDPLELLRSTTLFSSCDDADLGAIAALSETVEVGDGEQVFGVGEQSERLFIIDHGDIVVSKEDDTGRMVDIARFLDGDIIGELDMFTSEVRNAVASSIGSSTLLAFPRFGKRYSELSESHPAVSARLLNTFLVQISARIRGINALVRENSPVVQELKRQVYVDKLTGLYNKTYFTETLDQIVREADGTTGLLMYKPDNFKIINDTHGHEAGDKTLRFISDSLGDYVADREMLFRYAGNENAIILPNADRTEVEKQAERHANFLRSLDLAPVLDGDSIVLSVSFGMGLAPEHGATAEALIDAVHPLPLEGRRRGGNHSYFPEDIAE